MKLSLRNIRNLLADILTDIRTIGIMATGVSATDRPVYPFGRRVVPVRVENPAYLNRVQRNKNSY